MNIPISNTDFNVASHNLDRSESVHAQSAEYFSEIVASATLAPPGMEIQTFLQCRRRPDQKQCTGHIVVQLQEKPAQLHWWCTECKSRGIIRNWKGTPGFVVYTKDSTMSRQTECEITLSRGELFLLDSINIIEPSARFAVKQAKLDDDEAKIQGTFKTFDTIMGYIAFEANHTDEKDRQQNLNLLLNKLKENLDPSLQKI